MKINYRRIIKVLSSCVAIAMVLVVTVAMPVFAYSNKVYTLSDLYLETNTVGDDVVIKYSLSEAGVVPYIYEYPGTVQDMFIHGNRLQWTFAYASEAGECSVDFRSYLLGVVTNPTNTGEFKANFLDVSDFKAYSTLDFSMSVHGDTGLTGTSFGGGSVNGVHFKALWAISWVDAEGNKLSTSQSDAVTYQVEGSYGQFRFDVPGSFVVPENAVYMIPQLRVVVTSDGFRSGYSLVYMELDRSFISASYNAVVENSVTMQKINEKLGDIDDTLGSIDQSIQEGNNKLDEIINGNDQMAGSAQDSHEDLQDAQAELMDAVNAFDDATDLDKLLPNRNGDAFDIDGIIARNGLSDAWDALLSRFKPILSHGYFPEILLMVVACINISVLLIGR